MYIDEYKGDGLKWSIRKGDKIIDSSHGDRPAAKPGAEAEVGGDVVARLAQAMLAIRATKSAEAKGRN